MYDGIDIPLDPDTWVALQERLHRPPSNGALQDVYDGDGYQVHKHFLSQPSNISLLLNTDGVAGLQKYLFGQCGLLLTSCHHL